MVTRDDWVHVCQNVKDQCTSITKGLVAKLDKWFSVQDLMNATCIIYPQYYLQLEAASMFLGHLQILKTHYCHARMMQPNGVYQIVFAKCCFIQASIIIFVTTMQSNCSFAMLPLCDCNPTTRMWRWMANS